jgi:hypothetical protein
LVPPSEACSPPAPHTSSLDTQAFPSTDGNPFPETDLLLQPEIAKDTLKGLDIMEHNLLT